MNTIEPTIGCETINTKVNFEYLIKTYLIKYNKTIFIMSQSQDSQPLNTQPNEALECNFPISLQSVNSLIDNTREKTKTTNGSTVQTNAFYLQGNFMFEFNELINTVISLIL